MNSQNDRMSDNEATTIVVVGCLVGLGLIVLPTLTVGLVVGAWFRSLP